MATALSASMQVPGGSVLERLAPELLEDIAVYAGTLDAFGASPALAALVRTSRRLHALLAPQHNTHVYARIFRKSYDTTAPARRLGAGWLKPANLLTELRARYVVLARVRSGIVPHPHVLLADLWTIYLMLLEDDGKNGAQLIEGANVGLFVMKAMAQKARYDRSHRLNWFRDHESAALILWISWMIQTDDAVDRETEEDRHDLNYFLQEIIVAGFKYPSFHALDTHHVLPLCHHLPQLSPSACGPPPIARQLVYFGRPLTLAAPVLTPVALLLAHARYERGLGGSADAAPERDAPPTRADIAEYERRARIATVERSEPLTAHGHLAINTDHEEGCSNQYDEDWSRLVGCYDPHLRPPLWSRVFTRGALSGCWAGTIVTPDLTGFARLLADPSQPAATVPWTGRPYFVRLREHHCLAPSAPLASGRDHERARWGDDVLNAWFPTGFTMRDTTRGDAIEIADVGAVRGTRYETWVGDDKDGYTSAVARRVVGDLIQEELGDHEGDGSHFGHRVDSGVRDIIITGETDGRHGDAWGHYRFIGRVRPWDGLIVLLRIPTRAADVAHGRCVFRGYLHGDNFVGRWRMARPEDAPDRLDYEGSFVLTRQVDDW